MHQITGTSLAVKGILRFLTETVEMLALIRLKDYPRGIMVSFRMDVFIDIISFEFGA